VFHVEPISRDDVKDVVAILYPIVKDTELKKKVHKHQKNGITRVMRSQGKIVGIFMALIRPFGWSLSYYWLDESVRRKPSSLFFFLNTFSKMKGKIYIKSEDTSTFDRYIRPTKEKGVYEFIGFGDDLKRGVEKWAE